jgi:hypothetical protein
LRAAGGAGNLRVACGPGGLPGVGRGLATLGVAGTLGAAGVNWGVNTVLVAASLEVGITIGSSISAIPVNSHQSLVDWVTEKTWNLMHGQNSCSLSCPTK